MARLITQDWKEKGGIHTNIGKIGMIVRSEACRLPRLGGGHRFSFILADSSGVSAPEEDFAVNVTSAAVALTGFTTDGTNFQVTYSVANVDAAPFDK